MVRGNDLKLQKLKDPVTMEQLLEHMIKKTRIQCKDDHRLIVAALNGTLKSLNTLLVTESNASVIRNVLPSPVGLAGLYLLSNRWKDAAGCYREVLQRAEKHKEHFETNPLQLLHALDNLAEILDGSYDGVGYTLNEAEKLRPQAAEIREKYVQKYAQAVASSKNVVDDVTNQVVVLMGSFSLQNESWLVKTLHRAVTVGKDGELIYRIKDDLTHKAGMLNKKFVSIAAKCVIFKAIVNLL